MKLHLPKGLFVAVLAAITFGSAAYADPSMDGIWKWEGDKNKLIYYVATTDNRAVDATNGTIAQKGTPPSGTDLSGYNEYYVWSDENITATSSVTFSSFTLKDGDTVHIENSGWMDTSSNTDTRYFNNLIISGLVVENSGTAKVDIGANQTVTLGSITGTISTSVAGTAKLYISGSNADTNGDLVVNTTGAGDIVLTAAATLNNGDTSRATGDLRIQNTTLTIGGDKSHTFNLNSFTSWTLDKGTIQYHGANVCLNDLTVTSNGGEIQFYDMKGDYSECETFTLAGTTMLNGALSIKTTEWKSTTAIEKLAGAGNLDIESSAKYDAATVVNVQGMSNYYGDITITKNTGSATLNLSGMLNAGTAESATTITAVDGATINVGAAGVTTTLSGNIEFASAINLNSILNISDGAKVSFNGQTITLNGSSWFTRPILPVTLLTQNGVQSLSYGYVIATGNVGGISGQVQLSGTQGMKDVVNGGIGIGDNNYYVIAENNTAYNKTAHDGISNFGGYVVTNGATFDLNLQDDSEGFQPHLYLDAGSTITNNNSGLDTTKIAILNVTLLGDATVDAKAGHQFGMLRNSWWESTLVLEGHTLTKKGDGIFHLVNTTVSNGTIDVTEGTLLVESRTDYHTNGTVFNNATVNVSQNGTLQINSMKDEATVVSLLTSTTGTGNIALNTNATLDDVNTKATGLLVIKSGGTLTVGNGSNDTASISSFTKGVELAGGTLAFNGKGQELASLKVTSAGSLKMSNVGSGHQTYIINGTTNLEADLSVNSAVDLEHGTLRIKDLTGKGSIYVSGGSNNDGWGEISLKVDKLTDYTGIISVDGENHDVNVNFVEFGSASGAGFQTLEGLVVSNKAYSTVHGKGATTIKELTLANATHKYHTYGTGTDNNGYSHTISKLTINGSGTIATTGNDGWQTEISIGELKNAEGTKTGDLYITSANNTTQRSIVNLNGGDFAGTINVTASNSSGGRKLALNINDADVAANAEIKLNGNGQNVALGVGAAEVTVKGISDASNASGTMSIVSGAQAYNTADSFASDDTERTLVINTAGGEYSTSATVDKNLNIEKQGEGSQTFSGNVSAFNGSLSATAGMLAFTSAETLNIKSLNVQQGAEMSVSKADAVGTLTVNTAATFNGGNVNANLTLADNATVTINSAVTLGSASNVAPVSATETAYTLSLGSQLTLQGSVVEDLGNLAPGSGEVILFSGVDTLELGGEKYNVGAEALTAASGVKLSEVFRSDSVDLEDYYIGFNANGDVYAGLIVPEPATATLSLLALAGLCARRRRK